MKPTIRKWDNREYEAFKTSTASWRANEIALKERNAKHHVRVTPIGARGVDTEDEHVPYGYVVWREKVRSE